MKRSAYRYAFGAVLLALTVACSGASTGVDVKVDVKSAQATLDAAMKADADFAAMAAKDGPKAAFLAYMDPADSQRIEPGAVVKGAEEIGKAFDQLPPGFALEWAPDGGHGSASGDLAVTTGRFTVKTNGETVDQGRYVTVWRKDDAGALKAVMDLGVPDPGPKTEGPDPEGRPG